MPGTWKRFFCFALLLVCVFASPAAQGYDAPSSIEPGELIDIALDGRDPLEIVGMAWQSLESWAKPADSMEGFTWDLRVRYFVEWHEPVLEVRFTRISSPGVQYRTGVSIGLFEPVYVAQ